MKISEIQEKVWENKVKKGFNTTNVAWEFCLLNGEVAEAFDAYNKKKDDLGEELADVAIYLMGLSEMLGINLEEEIIHKMDKNAKRVYKVENGVTFKVES